VSSRDVLLQSVHQGCPPDNVADTDDFYPDPTFQIFVIRILLDSNKKITALNFTKDTKTQLLDSLKERKH
jgi:hypothetical protein